MTWCAKEKNQELQCEDAVAGVAKCTALVSIININDEQLLQIVGKLVIFQQL